jgi:hypothetical protein
MKRETKRVEIWKIGRFSHIFLVELSGTIPIKINRAALAVSDDNAVRLAQRVAQQHGVPWGILDAATGCFERFESSTAASLRLQGSGSIPRP